MKSDLSLDDVADFSMWNERIGYFNKKENKLLEDVRYKLIWDRKTSYNILEPIFLWGQSKTQLFVQIRFTQKIDIPRFTDVTNVKVDIGYDSFEVQAVYYKAQIPIYFGLKLHTFQHIIPNLSEYSYKDNTGIIELVLEKPFAIAWRNIHYQTTTILRNQYAWTEINNKYRDELEDDWAVFDRAQKRLDQVEDTRNREIDQKIHDKKKKQENQILYKNRQEDYDFYERYCFYGDKNNCEYINELHWSYWHI